MSRSKKKAIYKDKGLKKTYHKVVRSNVNQVVRESKKLEDLDEVEIPDEKTIINDYDYCDYSIDAEHDNDPRWAGLKIKLRRK